MVKHHPHTRFQWLGTCSTAAERLLQVDPHTQKSVDVQDHGADVHGLCEGCVVIAAQDGSHQDRALGVVSASARRVEVEVGEIRAYDRGEVVCH